MALSKQKKMMVAFATVCLEEIKQREPNSPNLAVQKVAEQLPKVDTVEDLEKHTKRIWSFLEEDEPFIMLGDTATLAANLESEAAQSEALGFSNA